MRFDLLWPFAPILIAATLAALWAWIVYWG